MGRRLLSFLHIRPEELPSAVLVSLTVFVPSFGSSIGLPGMESLFFTRFGVEGLPEMYIWVGVVTIVLTILLSVSPGEGRLLYRLLPLFLVFVLAAERTLLGAGLGWVYPVIYLSVYIVFTLQTFVIWGTASTVFHARQSKRLFPLFAASGILGTALGGLLTRFVVPLLGTENLMLVWALSLAMTSVLTVLSLRQAPPPRSRRSRGGPSVLAAFRLLGSHRLVRWLSITSLVVTTLYFFLVYPFSVGAVEQFPDEGSLAGFFGLFSGSNTAAAFIVSLFLASRVYTRFGLAGAILVLPCIFLLGFGGIALGGGFTFLVIFRFSQLAWQQGAFLSAFQALFNVVGEDKRERARQFADGVAAQLGTIVAGTALILIGPRQSVFLSVTLGLAVVGVVAAMFVRFAYRGALSDALREGRAGVFYPEEEPFGGIRWTQESVDTAVRGLAAADSQTRLVSAEILGRAQSGRAVPAIVAGLEDPEAEVRSAVVRALGQTRDPRVGLEVAGLLDDPDSGVRAEAIRQLPALVEFPRGLVRVLTPMLEDPDVRVRTEAAVALAGAGSTDGALELLLDVLDTDDPRCRRLALEGIAVIGGREALDACRRHVEDLDPSCRAEALSAIARLAGPEAVPELIAALADNERIVVSRIADELERFDAYGSAETDIRGALVAALAEGERRDGALRTLSTLGIPKERRDLEGGVRAVALKSRDRAVRYAGHLRSIRAGLTPNLDFDGRRSAVSFLADMVQRQFRIESSRCVLAAGILARAADPELAVESLWSADAAERGVALEAVESMGERDLIGDLPRELEAFDGGAAESEPAPGSTEASPMDWSSLLDDDAEWVRLAAEEAARVTAGRATNGGSMKSIASLSTLERIIFLKQLPLFACLSPDDLKRIADISEEFLVRTGEHLVRQGEPGTEMYVIVSGELSIRVRTDSGDLVEIARRSAGEPVGEMAILSEVPRMATMVADGPVRVLSIPKQEFEQIMRARPDVSLAVIRVLCERLREAQGPSTAEPWVHFTGGGRIES